MVSNFGPEHARKIRELEQRTDRLAETLRTVVDLLVSADADLGLRLERLEVGTKMTVVTDTFGPVEPSATQSDGGRLRDYPKEGFATEAVGLRASLKRLLSRS